MSLWELMQKGGIVMWPILLVSVVAVAVFLERTWALQRRRVIPEGFVRALRSLIERGEAGQAETLCAQSASVFAAVASSGLQHRAGGREAMKEAMEEAGRMESATLERFVGVMGTMATVAPLLGLLGTVTGMIQVFKDISEQTDPQIAMLAGGIWEALLTTAFGLIVAIPAYIGYRHLLTRVDRLMAELEERALLLLDLLAPPRAPAVPSQAAEATP